MHRISGMTILSVSCVLAGCGGGGGNSSNPTYVGPPASSAQSITSFNIPTLAAGQNGTVTASASSGLPVTFASTTPAICTVSKDTVTALNSGTCTLTAAQSGNSSQNIYVNFPVTYNAATTLTQSVTISASSSAQAARTLLAPWLATPQTGSTAADSTATLEGLYIGPSGASTWTAIDGKGNFQFADGSNYYFGTAMVSGSSFSLSGMNTSYAGSASILVNSNVGVSGNYYLKSTLQATAQSAALSTTPNPLLLRYAPANGYAASAASIAGQWAYNDSNNRYQITLDSHGVLSGTQIDNLGNTCNLTGSILQTEAGSQHNLYAVSLTATGTTCQLNGYGSFSGLAAIDFNAAGPSASNGYYPVLRLTVENLNTISNKLGGLSLITLQLKNTALS